MQQLITRRLNEAGFQTMTAATAAEGLRMACQLHPAAITLDLRLGDDDGWGVLSDLKTDRATRDIPVVVVSVVGGHQMALDLGAVGYVQKPIAKTALISAIRDVLPAIKGAHVLCVDDEPESIEATRRMLTAAGIEVAVATSAEAALESVEQRIPDAIFVDLMMPRMSGFELVARLRARPALAGVPVIVLSARRLDPEDRVALNGHVDRVITKGQLRLSDLSATVRQTIAHRRELAPHAAR
jgi:CheY-like chemotaxis protein